MTNEETVTKAIEIAIKNGWASNIPRECDEWDDESRSFNDYEDRWNIEATIYNHEFAKALWPQEIKGGGMIARNGCTAMEYWQYHLQQMVIADNPIKYLGENLPN